MLCPLLLVVCCSLVNSLNVLIFSPAVLTSPVTFMSHIADTLTEAGHNVTVLSPIVDENLRKRVHSVKTNDVMIVEPDDEMKKELGPFIDPSDDIKLLWKMVEDPSEFEQNYKWIFDHFLAMCPNMFRNKEVIDELTSRHYDVAITEALSVCGLALFKMLKIERTIMTTSFTVIDFDSEYFGEPRFVSYVPSTFWTSSDQMTLLGRYQNLRASDAAKSIYEKFYDKEMQLLSEWTTSDWRELFPSVSAYFVNSNPYIDFARPVIQKTIPIGGISVDVDKLRAEKLSEEWNEILNKRPKNVLISFGSVAKSKDMPVEWRKNILKVIRSLPEVTFIWKYESDDTRWAEGVKNVKFVKWTPQSALLADNRVSAFVTHGGLGSTNEVCHLGKPALIVPIFGDQSRNAHMLARHNGSIYFDKFSLSNFNLLNESINSILFDENYRKNAERLADILRDQPSPPKQTVVKQVEFIGKYGPFPNMDPYGRKLSKIQLEMIDVFALIYLSYGLLFVFSIVVLKYLYNFLLGSGSVKQKKL